MKISLAPSAVVTGAIKPHFLTTYLVNDTLAIDAGCLGIVGTPADQARVRHILLTHSHIDHIASLPIFIENVYDSGGQPVTIHATQPVLECLQKDLFNDRIWPDFIALSSRGTPFLKLQTLHPGNAFELEGLRITAVNVNHVVPTCGFIVEDAAAAVVIAGDTGPTDELWARANDTPNLKAVFLEASFPNSMAELAGVAKHLTPETFGREVRKLKQPVAVIAVHIKARFFAEVVRELNELGLPRLQIAESGSCYFY